MLLMRLRRQQRKLVGLQQRRLGLQQNRWLRQHALQQFRQQQLELVSQLGKQGGVLRTQGHQQPRQPGQEVAVLQMPRQLLARLQVR